MKNRVQVVVLENERLQQELKSQRQEETLREQTLLDASVSGVYGHNLLFGISLPTLYPSFSTLSHLWHKLSSTLFILKNWEVELQRKRSKTKQKLTVF